VEAARRHIAAGAGRVVDLDLDSFLDRVRRDALMVRVAGLVSDKRVPRPIRRYLAGGARQEVAASSRAPPMRCLRGNSCLTAAKTALAHRSRTRRPTPRRNHMRGIPRGVY
jgi:hypothetical protein